MAREMDRNSDKVNDTNRPLNELMGFLIPLPDQQGSPVSRQKAIAAGYISRRIVRFHVLPTARRLMKVAIIEAKQRYGL